MALFRKVFSVEGTLLSFRRLFAALYIYSFYLHPPRPSRLKSGTARLATLIILATWSCVDNARIAARYNTLSRDQWTRAKYLRKDMAREIWRVSVAKGSKNIPAGRSVIDFVRANTVRPLYFKPRSVCRPVVLRNQFAWGRLRNWASLASPREMHGQPRDFENQRSNQRWKTDRFIV